MSWILTCQIYFLSLQMHSMTLSLSVRLQPTSRASNVVVCSVSLADMKQRKRGKTLNSMQTCAPWCFRGSMGDLIQGTCWGGNRLVLTKELNLGIIDSDKQICPWPVDLIFQAPYSYLQPSNAEFRLELHCLWQLNLTGGNRHDGKGLVSQKFLCTASFP